MNETQIDGGLFVFGMVGLGWEYLASCFEICISNEELTTSSSKTKYRTVSLSQKTSMLYLFQKLKVGVLVLIIFLSGGVVYAQESDLKAEDSDLSERIIFIQTCFDKGQTSGKVWSYGWIGFYGVMTGIQGVPAIGTDHNRLTNIVGASESLLGLAVLIIDPFHARSSGDDLRAIPESTPEELKLKLQKAESWLERNYKQEKLGRSWLIHAGVVAGSMLEGGAVWHDDGFKSGVISFLAGVAVGEIQIWTQPTRGIRDYNDYHNKYKGAYHNVPKTKYFITPSANGIVAGVYF